MKHIKHIFFDLDHTLWDFDKNSSEALIEIFHEIELNYEIDDLDHFISTYKEINAGYWHKYNHGHVTKEQIRTERFRDVLTHFNVNDVNEKAHLIGNLYLQKSPNKKNIFPNTHETLTYLKNSYQLHIITNGFQEVQFIKMDNCNLTDYFDLILCTDQIGVNKPNPVVFETALKKTGALSNESLMIGDNPETDIQGAANCGFSTILFNPHQNETEVKSTQISDLKELMNLL